jgi:uncharacterized protein (TIGR03067 family)
MRSLLTLSALLLLSVPASAGDGGKLDGTWQITAMIDDGDVVSAATVRDKYAKDGRLTISGQSITVARPGTGEKKTLLFISDPKANPPTLDLAGSDKTGGKGIYLLAGDTLMVCLSGNGIAERPASFGSDSGSQNILITLQRVNPDKEKEKPAQPAPVLKQSLTDADIQKQLTGTWGYQNKEWVDYNTFNDDGSFSATRTYKRGFLQNVFEDDRRSSGTWKIKEGVLILNITASTDNQLKGQVYSYRINSINSSIVIFLNGEGQVRQEWKVR